MPNVEVLALERDPPEWCSLVEPKRTDKLPSSDPKFMKIIPAAREAGVIPLESSTMPASANAMAKSTQYLRRTFTGLSALRRRAWARRGTREPPHHRTRRTFAPGLDSATEGWFRENE